MDSDNPLASREADATSNSVNNDESSSPTPFSADQDEANSTSNSAAFENEINESVKDEDVSQDTGRETTHGSLPEAESGDFIDKNASSESEFIAPPVSHSEHTDKTSANGVHLPSESGRNDPIDVENSRRTETGSEGTSIPSKTEVVGSIPENRNENIQDSTVASNSDNRVNDQYSDVNSSPYYIKWIMWKGVKTPIVTQNDNGPCPLLAIINVLLLRRAIKFPTMQEMVTTQQLMEYLGDVVLKEIPENMGEGAQRNFEQNMQDALSILPKLTTGLDVNVKFTGVGDFEFTPECVIFDLLKIRLYHGWLVDPQSIEYRAAIAGLSYNQLVEKIVASKEPNVNSQLVSEGLFAESFLQETANQLTYHGVCELNAKVKEDQLCVFFRNNHFSTLFKHKGELLLLLTDQGFLTEDNIVWQTLSNVDGDGLFVDCNFKTLPLRNEPMASVPAHSSGALSQEDQDFMLALSIQEEQQQQQQQPQQQPSSQPVLPPTSQSPTEAARENQGNNGGMSEQELYDLQYAMQLQEEEEARARTGQQQQQQQQQQQHRQQQQQRSGARRHTPPPSPAIYDERNLQTRQRGREICVIL